MLSFLFYPAGITFLISISMAVGFFLKCLWAGLAKGAPDKESGEVFLICVLVASVSYAVSQGAVYKGKVDFCLDSFWLQYDTIEQCLVDYFPYSSGED